MRNILIKSTIFIFTLASIAFASGAEKPRQEQWSFDGIFGHFDKQAIQRGFQVYKEVCSACHSLDMLYFRNLEEVGFSKEEVASLAASYEVSDGPNDQGEMFKRPGKPFDKFVAPYPNEQAARTANNGAYPPDFSLIVKARPDGANYIHALLNGYGNTPPTDMKIANGMSYNPYFPGGQIAMPQPLSEGMVTYEDGTASTVEQMSYDVVNFLQWAAEPEMEKRKSMGLKVIVYLFIFTIVFYVAKSRIWAKLD